MLFRLPRAARVIANPSPQELKELTARMPNARPTRYGNLNVQTKVVSRSKRSTYIATDEPDGQNQAIPRDEALRLAELQDEYIAGRERRTDRRALGDGQDDDDLHAPERLAARAGRLRRMDAERPRVRDGERLLREDVRPQSR